MGWGTSEPPGPMIAESYKMARLDVARSDLKRSDVARSDMVRGEV